MNNPGGTLAAGATLQLAVVMRDSNGAVLPLGVVTWSSSNTTVATVTSAGLLTARVQGTATITASTAGLAATAAFTIVPVPVATVSLTPTSATLQLGTTAQFTAVARDAGGLTLAGRPISWSSSNAAVFTVAAGLVTTVGVGTATLTATSEGKTANATVTVENVPVATVQVAPPTATVQIGAQTQLTATTRDAGGGVLAGRVVTWTSGATGIARVSGNGLIDGLAQGTATITARSEGQSGTATITVIPVPVATLILVPQSVTVQVGATTTFAATPRDANGNPLTGRTITWSTANGSIAQVSPAGVVSGIAPGSVLISGNCEGVVGSAFVTITTVPATLVQVTIAPATAALQSGQTQQFSLSGQLSDGSTIPVTGSYTAQAGTVNGSGLYTAPDQSGTFRVIGTANGTSLRDTALVTVTRPPVATLVLTPSSATVDVGQTVSFTATTRDASGNILTNRTITWVSTNTVAATVSTGVAAGRAVGSTNIIATSEGQSDTSALTVQLTPVANIQVTPSALSLQLGTSAQLSAVTRDANGNILTGRVVTWSSNSPNVTVNTTGRITGAALGAATITASSEGLSTTALITVQASTGPAPVLVEDFSTYTSTSNMLSDPRGIYTPTEDVNTSDMSLDLTVGYGSSTKSMRYTFGDRTGDSNRCHDNSITRNLSLPSDVDEVWVELYARFSTNFQTRAPSSWGCTSNPDYKFLHGRVRVSSRYEWNVGVYGSSFVCGIPPDPEGDHGNPSGSFGSASDVWDGQWHQYRLHWRNSSSSGRADGAAHCYLDGVLVKSFDNVVISNGSIYGFKLGANMNQGPAAAQSVWWGRLRAWDTNPGW